MRPPPWVWTWRAEPALNAEYLIHYSVRVHEVRDRLPPWPTRRHARPCANCRRMLLVHPLGLLIEPAGTPASHVGMM